MQKNWKSFAIAMMLVLVLSVVSSTAFAGGADPEPAAPAPAPVFDERVCGEAGAVTESQTTRWTNIFTTAHPDSDTGNAYEPNTPVTILGRDFWGCWISVQTAVGNGWIPVDAITTKAVMDLPVLVDNSDTPPAGSGPAPAPAAPAAPAAGGGGGDCVIPASGPWPACATGNAAPPSREGCVVPTSGPWPECAR